MASVNDKLERVRKPRVHIKYDVETEGAQVEKELPFTVGVLGDYSGNQPGVDKKSLRERKFVNIDRDNFDQVMTNITPGVSMKVDNVLDQEKTDLQVDLQFQSMQDFEPEAIVEQVPALKELKQIRDQLRELLTKADRSDELEKLLESILSSNDRLHAMHEELNKKSPEES